MKFLYSTLLLMLTAGSLLAQPVDRTKPPKPGPAPTINITDPASFTLPNGLRVFVVTNSKLPQVSATLTLDRDPLFEGEKAGVSSMAGAVMRRGTTTMSKAELDEAVDFLGASLSASSVSVSGNSLKGNFPELMKLMADVALRPAFSAEELEKVRKQTLSGLASEKDDPSAIGRRVSRMLVYGKNHPYGESETEETVKKITAEDVKQYHATWWKPNIAYLIFVGDITPAAAKELATKYFGGWQKGDVPKAKFGEVKLPAKSIVAIVDRPASVQSVINVSAPVNLQPGAPDDIPASVMNTILGGGFSSRLMQNLREKYGFTYGARSSLSSDKLVGRFAAGASVRNEKTDSAVGQFLYELNRIRNSTPSDSELTSIKNYMSGEFARSLEEPATIAGFALNTAVYSLPKDYYRNYLTRLSSVSKNEIKGMADKYVPANNLVITIVGNAKEIAPGLEKYGELKFFDVDGNPIAAPTVKKIEGDLKAADIFKKALDAYGGEAAISKVKDLSLSGDVSMMGQTFTYSQKYVLPDGFSTSIIAGGMALINQSKKGDEYSSTMQGQSLPVSAEDKDDLKARAALMEEREYLANPAYKAELKGIESIDGKDAYHVRLTKPGGGESSIYYDVATGLKVQESYEQEGPMGKANITIKVKEYGTYEGIKVPVKVLLDAGMLKQDIFIKEVKVNQGLKLSDL